MEKLKFTAGNFESVDPGSLSSVKQFEIGGFKSGRWRRIPVMFNGKEVGIAVVENMEKVTVGEDLVELIRSGAERTMSIGYTVDINGPDAIHFDELPESTT